MPYDQATRTLLARTVAGCRDRLAQDIAEQLQSSYGLHPDGTALDVARTEDQRRAAEDLRALLRFVAENAQVFSREYGNISGASVAAIQAWFIVFADWPWLS